VGWVGGGGLGVRGGRWGADEGKEKEEEEKRGGGGQGRVGKGQMQGNKEVGVRGK